MNKIAIHLVGFLGGLLFGWLVVYPAAVDAMRKYELSDDTAKAVRTLRVRVEQSEKTISRLCQHLGFWPIQTPDGGLSCGVEGKKPSPSLEDGRQL